MHSRNAVLSSGKQHQLLSEVVVPHCCLPKGVNKVLDVLGMDGLHVLREPTGREAELNTGLFNTRS